VKSFYERQLAVESIRRVPGVHRVVDRIVVLSTSLLPKVGAAVVLFALALLTGCGGGDGVDRLKVQPVQGTVTFEGKPLANAQVAFHPKNPSDQRAKVALGTTDASDNFQLTTYDTNDGAVAGEFTVTVQYFQLQQSGESFSPGPNVLAPHKLPEQSAPAWAWSAELQRYLWQAAVERSTGGIDASSADRGADFLAPLHRTTERFQCV